MTADHMDAPDTIPVAPAEAATDIGADYDGAMPEGGAVALLLAAAALILTALGVVHLVVRFAS